MISLNNVRRSNEFSVTVEDNTTTDLEIITNHAVTQASDEEAKGTSNERRICLFAHFNNLIFLLKICGLFVSLDRVRRDMSNASCKIKRRRISLWIKRAHQALILLVLWTNLGRNIALFWIDKTPNTRDLKIILSIWSVQVALQASISAYSFQMTGSNSRFKHFLQHWNSQRHFDELVNSAYLFRLITITLITSLILFVMNVMLFVMLMFLPVDSFEMMKAFVAPFKPSVANKLIVLVAHALSSTAWILPLALYYVTCVTLIHQCGGLKKHMSVTVTAQDISKIKILRQQHSSLCDAVRNADRLLSPIALTVYLTSVPLVCFLLYDLIFVQLPVANMVGLGFWLLTNALTVLGISRVGALLNEEIHSFSEVLQQVEITGIDLDTHTELMLFLTKLNGDPVGMTAGGIIVITKTMIVTVAGVVFTYFLLLYELR